MLLVDIILEWLNRLVASAGPHPKPVIRPRTVVVTVPEENLAIKVVLETELSRGEHFVNHHGITTENLSSVLVDPFLVWVDPDDLETQPRAMWVVLQECLKPTDGYVIVYDPLHSDWNVAEYVQGGHYRIVVSGPSLAEALSAM